jgi:hypothetical protein
VAPPPPPSAAAPRPLEAAAREPKEGDRIAIPEDPKDLAFLAGCWTTGEGHRTGDGSQAVNRVCFDGRGRGTVTIDLLGSNGRVVESCRGRASASIEGKRIKMRQFSARCPRRGNFSGGTIWCEPVPAGEAKCEAKNASERHGFPIPIYYRGPA